MDKSTACPKCGSTDRDYGHLSGVTFLASDTNVLETAIGVGDTVVAIACMKCGDIELVLEKVPRDYAKRMEGKD
jgi:predicted nucleic-acid-binding Zn-ribbon protein